MAVLDGDTLQISAGTPENVERDIGIRPCVWYYTRGVI